MVPNGGEGVREIPKGQESGRKQKVILRKAYAKEKNLKNTNCRCIYHQVMIGFAVVIN